MKIDLYLSSLSDVIEIKCGICTVVSGFQPMVAFIGNLVSEVMPELAGTWNER